VRDGYEGDPPLEIPDGVLSAMLEHCRAEHPREACGILAGPTAPRVTSWYPLRNALASETLYDADRDDLIAAWRAMRARGEQFLAIYHSHPASAPVPSRVDLARNYYGGLPRLIVGLAGPEPEVRNWRLDDAGYTELGWRGIPDVEAEGEMGYRVADIQDARREAAQRFRVPGGAALRRPGDRRANDPGRTMERTLIIFKPDCVQRRLVGTILARFEAKGLRLAALRLMQVDRPLAEKHYAEHRERPFFGGLIDFLTGGPVVVGVLEGPGAIAVVRRMLGKTNGQESEPGTIRGDFSISKQNNLVHGSDGPESAAREIALWFPDGGVAEYAVAGEEWVIA
jgi:nucleoside-diphosphate kinase